MRRFIIKSFWFSFLFLLLTLPFLLFISSYDNIDRGYSKNSNIITLQTKSKFDSLDVLFLGNSYCYSGIQPAILLDSGINSYNLGIASAGVEFYELILTDYLNHIHKNPKEIFILLSPMTFSSKADNYLLYPFHRYLENPISNYNLILKNKRFKELFFLYKKSFTKGCINIINSRNTYQRRELGNGRGFVESDKVELQNNITNEQLYLPLLNEKFNHSKIESLKNLETKIQRKGIKITWFELPTNKLENYFNEEYLLEYHSALIRLNENNKVFIVNDKLFSPLNFRNIDHMNTSGSIIATNEIIRYTKSNRRD